MLSGSSCCHVVPNVPQISPAFPGECGMCRLQGKSSPFSLYPIAQFQVNSTHPQYWRDLALFLWPECLRQGSDGLGLPQVRLSKKGGFFWYEMWPRTTRTIPCHSHTFHNDQLAFSPLYSPSNEINLKTSYCWGYKPQGSLDAWPAGSSLSAFLICIFMWEWGSWHSRGIPWIQEFGLGEN